jgi:signal transduction histidine kinase
MSQADRVARDLLAHAPLIALSVGPDLKVGPGGTSLFAEELLGGGEGLVGREFAPTLLPEPRAAARRAVVEDWLRLIFEKPDQDWETILDLCPIEDLSVPDPRVGGEVHDFRLTYHPLRAGKGGPVVRVLVVGLDVTAERALVRELESRDEEGEQSVRRFAEVLKLGAETFRRFLNESLMRLSEAAGAAERLGGSPGDREAAQLLFRQAHTLKANARAFRLSWIAEAAESLESALAELRDAPNPGEHPALSVALDRLETLDIIFSETEELATQVFGRSLDPGEARGRDRDLEVPVRVGRLESALALVQGASVLLSRPDADPERLRELLARAGRSIESLKRVPARSLFQRFPKMVGDLAAIMGKRVSPLRVSGSETLVDIRTLDRVGDALVHMLRNAVAHGIEPPEARREAGKPEAGAVELSLRSEDGKVVFEVSDDGPGIDREAVRREAVGSGVVPEEEAGKLSDAEIDRLLFRPGFSVLVASVGTAGRGVGLDSVRAAAEFLEGAVEIESEPGRGTRVRLVIPEPGPS